MPQYNVGNYHPCIICSKRLIIHFLFSRAQHGFFYFYITYFCFDQSRSARNEKVFLRFKANQAVLTGQL